MTKPFRLNRRSVLRGAGGIVIALPWLEAMAPERASHAATALPQRFLSVYNPGGTILERWTPTGSEEAFALSPILAPFESLKDRLLVLSGIDMKSAQGGAWPYACGIVAWLTGTEQTGLFSEAFAQGPSVDQVIAARITGTRPRSSLNLGVRWGTGICMGKVHPMDIVNYGTDAAVTPIAPLIDPVAIWTQLFGANAATLTWERSILDTVDRRYARLASRLGAADRKRLEQHLTSLRELEQRLAATGGPHGSACSAPELIDTSSAYDPASGLTTSGGADEETDALIPVVGKLMMDMMVMALACDITAVGTLQWSDAEAEYTLPWLGLIGTHKCYMNDCGFNPTECEAIATWYSQQHAYLLGQMAQIDMGGHSLLDETVVFIGSDIQGLPTTRGRTCHFCSPAAGDSALAAGSATTTSRTTICSSRCFSSSAVLKRPSAIPNIRPAAPCRTSADLLGRSRTAHNESSSPSSATSRPAAWTRCRSGESSIRIGFELLMWI